MQALRPFVKNSYRVSSETSQSSHIGNLRSDSVGGLLQLGKGVAGGDGVIRGSVAKNIYREYNSGKEHIF